MEYNLINEDMKIIVLAFSKKLVTDFSRLISMLCYYVDIFLGKDDFTIKLILKLHVRIECTFA